MSRFDIHQSPPAFLELGLQKRLGRLVCHAISETQRSLIALVNTRGATLSSLTQAFTHAPQLQVGPAEQTLPYSL